MDAFWVEASKGAAGNGYPGAESVTECQSSGPASDRHLADRCNQAGPI